MASTLRTWPRVGSRSTDLVADTGCPSKRTGNSEDSTAYQPEEVHGRGPVRKENFRGASVTPRENRLRGASFAPENTSGVLSARRSDGLRGVVFGTGECRTLPLASQPKGGPRNHQESGSGDPRNEQISPLPIQTIPRFRPISGGLTCSVDMTVSIAGFGRNGCQSSTRARRSAHAVRSGSALQPWDLDHDDSDSTHRRYLGASHRRCNRAEPFKRLDRKANEKPASPVDRFDGLPDPNPSNTSDRWSCHWSGAEFNPRCPDCRARRSLRHRVEVGAGGR